MNRCIPQENAWRLVLGAVRAVAEHPDEEAIHMAGLRRAVDSYVEVAGLAGSAK